jgi:hypothetical protein
VGDSGETVIETALPTRYLGAEPDERADLQAAA